MLDHPYRFIDNENPREVFCHHLHDVEVVGGVTRFVPVVLRRTKDGDLVGEAPFHIILPNEAVGPALALTWSKTPSGVIVPAVGHLVRQLITAH